MYCASASITKGLMEDKILAVLAELRDKSQGSSLY
jgi:hypothetical protein